MSKTSEFEGEIVSIVFASWDHWVNLGQDQTATDPIITYLTALEVEGTYQPTGNFTEADFYMDCEITTSS